MGGLRKAAASATSQDPRPLAPTKAVPEREEVTLVSDREGISFQLWVKPCCRRCK